MYILSFKPFFYKEELNMAVKKMTLKNPETFLCDNFKPKNDGEKKRCINCEYLDNDKKLCLLKDNTSVIREVLEYKDLDDSYNYTCKEQLSYCNSCSCFCKDEDNNDFYCDFGKYGLGLAKRETIEWKEIESPTESICEAFKNKNPLGISLFSSSYCENCRYFLKDKGCMNNDQKDITKIKWTKIEDPKFKKCKLFERSTASASTILNTNNDVNCFKCKYFNNDLGCMNKKAKPKESFKPIEKPELHVCKAYKPSWLRKNDYKDSCITCEFFIKNKGCVNQERKRLKNLKRLSEYTSRKKSY